MGSGALDSTNPTTQQKLEAELVYLKNLSKSEASILFDHFPKLVAAGLRFDLSNVAKEGYKIAEETSQFAQLLFRQKEFLKAKLEEVEKANERQSRVR